MIRGCQRRIYYVKNPGGDVFDEAYFVIRKDYAGRGTTLTGEDEIADEAKRIVEQATEGGSKNGKREKLAAFIAGAAVALAVFAAVLLIVK